MWKKTLTIDKKYDKELRALLRELGKNKSLVFTVEEDRSRKVVSVASTGADINAANDYLCDRVARLLTTYFKHAFISDRLNKKEFDEAEACLMAVMIYYDCEGDYAEIFDKLRDYEVISVDGVYNFAIKDIKEDWQELCDVSGSLFDGSYCDDDLYDVACYVVEEKADRTRLMIADAQNPVVTDVAKGVFVTVDDFYGDKRLNLINCAVGCGAKEITFDAGFKDKKLFSALSRFAKIKII